MLGSWYVGSFHYVLCCYYFQVLAFGLYNGLNVGGFFFEPAQTIRYEMEILTVRTAYENDTVKVGVFAKRFGGSRLTDWGEKEVLDRKQER